MYKGPISPGVRARVKIEETIVLSLVDELLAQGFVLSVHDGEEQHPPTTDRAAIVAAIMETDGDTLVVFKAAGDAVAFGWFRLVYGNDGFDVISDYTTNLDELFPKTKALADKIEAGEYRILAGGAQPENQQKDAAPKTLDALRASGHAVIVWTPEELGTANPRRVEDRSVELGWDVIRDLGGPEPSDD